MALNSTAKGLPYRLERGIGGEQYVFFCGISGKIVCVLPVPPEGDGEKSLELAYESTRPYFNRCLECGKWVCDEAYNLDEMKCVRCAPQKGRVRFCTECGSVLVKGSVFCVSCGSRIR